MSEWREVKIGDIAEKIAMGPFGSNIKVETFVETGIPIISGAHLHESRLRDGEYNYVTEDHAERMKNSIVFRGDVILTYAGSIGDVAYIPDSSRFEKYVISQRQFYLRCKLNQADPRFITYFFHSPEGKYKLLANTSQTGVPMIGQPSSYLKSIPILLPPLHEQKAIAHILGTLDDKIDQLRKTNSVLEDMASALFKSWFVDFDPVKAKLENRPTGLPKDLDDLFPDSFEDSALGPIPKGWRVGNLSECSKLNPESWTQRSRPDRISYVDLSNTKWGRIDCVTEFIADDAPSRAQRVLRPLDTIVGTVRPGNGSFAFISDNGLTGSTGFAVLRPLRREHAEFVYLAATSIDNIERLSNLADGGAYPAVRPEVVSMTLVSIATHGVLDEFSQLVGSMMRRIAENVRISNTLTNLRDTLLPKLISGDLRVSEAEQMVAELGL